METTNVLEKFTMESDYKEVAAAAKKYGIPYVGVKKKVFLEQVNERIDQINSGEAPSEVVEEPKNEVVEQQPTGDGGQSTDQTDKPKNEQKPAQQAKPATTPRQTGTPRAKGAKWYETTAPLYNPGDIVNIIAGPCLVGRKAQITQPSAKKDAMKCKLINPKDGSLQGTEITMDYYKLELFKAAGAEEVEVAEQPTSEPVVNENPDGSAEDTDTPEVREASESQEEVDTTVVDEQPALPEEDPKGDSSTDEEHSA